MSNILIVHAPKSNTFDYDYIAFNFNGKNSYDDFGIYRIGDGGGYNLPLTPEMEDQTADFVGADGQYYFSTFHKKKVFTVNFAFDSLTEVKLRELKQWLSGKQISSFWFSETPYKVYQAKVTGQPTLQVIPFSDNTLKRVYKGTGTIQFTCYYPFARTPDKVQIWNNTSNSWVDQGGGTGDNDGRSLKQYKVFSNFSDWSSASGLIDNPVIGKNFGDLPAPFIISTDSAVAANTTITVGDQTITVLENCGQGSSFMWDSKTGAVTAIFNNVRRAVNYSGNSLATIPVTPVGGNATSILVNGLGIGGTAWSIKYHYWYY